MDNQPQVRPEDWTVDQVIYEFCHNDKPLWISHGLKPIPSKETLESRFRDNDVDGAVLLELDMEQLKNDLNITSLGQRKTVAKVIEFLRGEDRPSMTPAPLSLHEKVGRFHASMPTPDISRRSLYAQSAAWESNNGAAASALDSRPQDSTLIPTTQHFRHRQSNSFFHDEPFLMAQRANNPQHGGTARSPTQGSFEEEINLGEPQHNSMMVNVDSQNFDHDRLEDAPPKFDLLDALDMNINQSLQPSNAAQQRPQELTGVRQQLKKVKPKRIMPTRIGPVRTQEVPQEQEDFYLQRESISMQESFFGPGNEEDDDQSFFIANSSPSHATSIVIARRLKHFLLQRPQKLPGFSYGALYALPYGSEKCAGPVSEPFLTIFAPNAEPSVEKLCDWPELDEYGKQAIHTSSKQTSHRDSIVAIREHNAFSEDKPQESDRVDSSDAGNMGDYAYLLEKYPPALDDSEALPMYGDSGDENEYDEDLLQEIEDEQQERNAHRSGMTHEQIVKAVDDATAEIKEKWKVRKLPKVRSKAYHLWMKVAKAKRRSTEVEGYYAMRGHKIASLKKMREIIIKDTWKSVADVKAICDTLEETVFQILEAEHMLEVLHQKDAPAKPPTRSARRRPRPKPVEKDGEETLESESEDEFVVYDGDAVIPEDPMDEDFDPNLPRSSAKGIARSAAAASQQSDKDKDIPMPDVEETEQFKAVRVAEDVEERQIQGLADTPLPVDDDDGDADIDSDSDICEVLSRGKKKTPTSHRPIQREDWSPSPQNSPTLPPSVPQAYQRITRRGSDSENSDLDAPERLPPSKFKHLGASKDQAIELLSSDPARPEDDDPSGFDSITTPPLNPILEETSDDPIRSKPTVRLRDRLLSTTQKQRTASPQQSEYVENISAMEQALNTIARDKPEQLDRVSVALAERPILKRKDLSTLIGEGLSALNTTEPYTVSGFNPNARETETVLRISELFLSFFFKKDLVKEQAGFTLVNEAHSKRADLDRAFEKELKKSLKLFLAGKHPAVAKVTAKGKQKNKTSAKRRYSQIRSESDRDSPIEDTELEDLISGAEEIAHHTPHKRKKKKQVAESQEAKAVQKSDQARVREQAERRALLSEKMKLVDADASAKVIVNAREPLILLDSHIASRVKEHQKGGIQFLWREIVADPRHQGCLLAHTMGLGKTMQVISLLVSIAQSSVSPTPGVAEQLPAHLLENRTLVLCPASLIENWYDELLMWTPSNDDCLGGIFKISGRADAGRVEEWANDGGVLIVSYETFRSLLKPSKNTRQEEHDKVPQYEKWLLDTPSLVVADEAHKIKNPKAGISVQAQRFKTKSRIALTGSPLNNHLEEYHTMIEWIAHDYLGDIEQFRDKYVNPINEGLYQESTQYERRICLRKLHTLKKDIEPKVNRADISAIRDDMPPKTEYIITIPLTESQREGYDTYVMHVLKEHESGGVKSNGFFKWIKALQVLVAHPSCFVKVYEKHRSIKKADESSTETDILSDDEARKKIAEIAEDDYDPMSVKKVTHSDLEAEEAASRVFDSQSRFGSLYDEGLSHRTMITKKIVEKSVAGGEKILVFSHSIPTLDYLEDMLKKVDPNIMRIDGSTRIPDRQKKTKTFNDSEGASSSVFLLSTEAAGLGLNLQGANRVILFDFSFNPMWEEQAVGRAYRLGQQTDCFVYRFKCGGTFEEPIYHKALFKTQLFQRVVDKKNPTRAAAKTVSQYLFKAKTVEKHDLSQFRGRDPKVLDKVLEEVDTICNLELTETFQREDGEKLDEDDLRVANAEQEIERLRREDPEKYNIVRKQALLGPPGSQAPRLKADGKETTTKVAGLPRKKYEPSSRVLGQHLSKVTPGLPGQVSAEDLQRLQIQSPTSQLPHGRHIKPAGDGRLSIKEQKDTAIRVDGSDSDSPPETRTETSEKTQAEGCKSQ